MHHKAFTINTNAYELTLKPLTSKTTIDFIMTHPVINTKDLPKIKTQLELLSPDVFKTQCFNDRKVSFAKEVESTEIAHLFEHLLLEHTQKHIFKKTGQIVDLEGYTQWDWHLEPEGVFHIHFKISHKFWHSLKHAINTSNTILNSIIDAHDTTPKQADSTTCFDDSQKTLLASIPAL